MQKICANPWCRQPFDFSIEDRALLDRLTPVIAGKKYSIPEPTLCPTCRSQRRLAHRNERILYKRTCDLTKKPIVSIYSADAPCNVYAPDVWYSDGWDPMQYGIDVDFSVPFSSQVQELRLKAPRPALAVIQNENCPYVNQVWQSKNCHLCIDGGFDEDVLYSYATYHSRNVTDCAFTRECERSFDLLDCSTCYGSQSCIDCKNCAEAYYSIDCAQCSNIAFCSNLRGKKYCLFNREIGKEEWERQTRALLIGSSSKRQECAQTFHELCLQALRRENHNVQCEDCTGDYLASCRNCYHCFDADKSEDLRYCARPDEQLTTCMDIDHGAMLELGYEDLSAAGHGIYFCHASYSTTNSNLLYCDLSFTSSDCFGCVAMKNGRYCILNKQYSKEEYESLVPKIIEHMRSTGEWGEFFPAELSLFGYNESAAQQYYPITKEEIEGRGWRWREQTEEPQKVSKTVDARLLPDAIDGVPDDILNWAILCEDTKRPYRIIKQELEFYRTMQLPVPHLHPNERHRRRMELRNPRKLWKRKCGKCGKEMETTYSPERPEKVYCEECYLKEVY
ncbi:MAG: hypothetical protein WCG83_07320 [Candidatus Peregrinibacteria bacterium]